MHYQRRAKPKAKPGPSAMVVNIAVDTTYLYVQSSRLDSGMGIFPMGNDASRVRSREAASESGDLAGAGSEVAFNIFPIEALGDRGDNVQIVGIELSDGRNTFGKWGLPKQPAASASYQWVGTAMTQKMCNYQLRIAVSNGDAPVKYVMWVPFSH